MVKKLFIYIFIYTLTVGCHAILGPQDQEIWPDVSGDESCVSEYILDIEAPDLFRDSTGYYYIEWIDGYVQTFTTLSAKTESKNYSQKVFWSSNSGIYHMNEWVSSVNPASYTGEDGIANSVLAVWEEHIADTVMVYAAFEDECKYIYYDSLGVIVK